MEHLNRRIADWINLRLSQSPEYITELDPHTFCGTSDERRRCRQDLMTIRLHINNFHGAMIGLIPYNSYTTKALLVEWYDQCRKMAVGQLEADKVENNVREHIQLGWTALLKYYTTVNKSRLEFDQHLVAKFTPEFLSVYDRIVKDDYTVDENWTIRDRITAAFAEIFTTPDNYFILKVEQDDLMQMLTARFEAHQAKDASSRQAIPNKSDKKLGEMSREKQHGEAATTHVKTSSSSLPLVSKASSGSSKRVVVTEVPDVVSGKISYEDDYTRSIAIQKFKRKYDFKLGHLLKQKKTTLEHSA
jgi:hypothetical protein